MQRRSFLKRLASAGILLPISGVPTMRAFAQPAGIPMLRGAADGNDRVMVIIRLFGGNDGLNTLVPFRNDRYYNARGRGTAFDVSIAPEKVLRIPGSDELGFHPAFAPLGALYGEGKMAIVQNVGYPGQDLSHFRSTDIWLSGSDADVYRTSGWYARYLEEKHPAYPEELPDAPFAIEMGTYIGTTLIGERGDMGVAFSEIPFVPVPPADGDEATTNAGIEERFVRETLRQSGVFLDAVADAYRGRKNLVPYPQGGSPLTDQLAAIARMIAGGLGTQLYVVNVDGFDTHFDQPNRHAYLLNYIATAMHAFQRDLEAMGLADRVCMMTISEFGRRVESNGTGTDHGAAAPMFIIGRGVNPGIIGSDPDLDDLDTAGNLKMQFDFRQIYASVLGQWLGAAETEIAPHALPRSFAQLPLFRPSDGRLAAPASSDAALRLDQNAPNPAGLSTTIAFDGIPQGSAAMLWLHTLDGRLLLTRPIRPQERNITLDLRGIPPGTYLYTLRSGPLNRSRLMTVRR